MRILHTITSLDPDGAQTMLLKLVSRSHGIRYRHAVLTLRSGGGLEGRFEEAGVQVFQAHATGVASVLGAFWTIARAVRSFEPDLIQGWLAHGNLTAELAALVSNRRVPVVWNVRDTQPDLHSKGPRALGAASLAARLSGRPVRIVNNSMESARVHTDRLGYESERWTIIPNGFDTHVFRPSADDRARLREEIGVRSSTPLVGVVKRYHPDKGHATFFDAARTIAERHPNVKFLLAGRGTGSDNTRLVSDLAARGILDRFVLLGQRNDMPCVQAALDVAVSSSETEGFPNTIGEAMACEVPCAVTNVGDSAHLVGDSGAVVAPRDPAGLADAVSRLLDLDAEERAALGRRARRRIEHAFSLDSIVRRYESLYAAVMTSTQRSIRTQCAE